MAMNESTRNQYLRDNICPGCRREYRKSLVGTILGHLSCMCGHSVSLERYWQAVETRVNVDNELELEEAMYNANTK